MHEPHPSGRIITGENALAALSTALAVVDHPAPEPVIEWVDRRQLAALDVDFHGVPLDARPDERQLGALVRRIRPQPAMHWRTHGRGLRLIYVAAGDFTAEELAAVALISARALEPAAAFEILAHTRHPRYPRPDYPDAGPIVTGVAAINVDVLRAVLQQQADDEQAAQWLAERGLERGRRYDHDRCPVDPDTPSHGEPVIVGDEAITCFRCQGQGISLGGGPPGVFAYTALIGSGISAKLLGAARHFCHWEHAKFVVAEELGLEGDLGRLAYHALMKVLHGANEPRIDEALLRGVGLVRMDGFWATSDLARAHLRDGLESRLKVLPAVCDLAVDDDGQRRIVSNRERLGVFRGVDDLSRFGYPQVLPVRGLKIRGRWSPPDPRVVRAVVLPAFLCSLIQCGDFARGICRRRRG